MDSYMNSMPRGGRRETTGPSVTFGYRSVGVGYRPRKDSSAVHVRRMESNPVNIVWKVALIAIPGSCETTQANGRSNARD